LLPAAALAAEGPSLFHVAVAIERLDEGSGVVADDSTRQELVGARASLRDEVSLTLSFDVSAAMRPVRGTGSSRYAWSRDLVHAIDSSTARAERGAESGNRLLDWDATVERSFRPLACEDLWVHDQVGDGRGSRSVEPPGSRDSLLRVRLRATWPGKVRVTDSVDQIPPFDTETAPSLDLDRAFPYDLRYASALRKGSFDSSGPAAGLLPPTSSRWTVEMRMTPIDPYEFRLEARVREDGSVGLQSRVVVGGRDVSTGLQVRRLLRAWVAQDSEGSSAPYALAADWRSATDDAWRPVPVPLSFEPVDPGPGRHARWLVEVLEMVEALPELGLLYHQVTVETQEGGPRYHATASEARPVSPETWCEIRGRGRPATDLPALAAGGPSKTLAEADFGSAGIATR